MIRCPSLPCSSQIPDLQGRRFNIEYAVGGAPDSYPIPSNLLKGDSGFPDAVVIDRLPQEIIQHVQTSTNPAITAALDAAIQREQRVQAFAQQRQGSNTVYHAAQHNAPVQESRPSSSSESESGSDVSSSDSDSEEVRVTQ